MERFEYGEKDALLVLLQPVDEHDLALIENEYRLIKEMTEKEFSLCAFRIENWNRDLSPWQAPAVFGKEAFGEGAAETLKEIMRYCEDRSRTYCIGGYSLAGLFALWACYQTDLFQGTAAASASLWFPGFADYMKTRQLHSTHVYLSLGDKEEKTRNPVMATVGDRTREAYALLKEQGIDCMLEWNAGNHFRDADLRTAKAFSWVMNRL
jgi:predicted esterase